MSDFNMMLAPTIDLVRDPFNPRAFETFSEDPLLTARLGVADTNGVQSIPGVGATLKHYNLNTQEHHRDRSTRRSMSARCRSSTRARGNR